MATDISMCSNALLLIGHGTISSFTEGGAGALVASNLYQSSYENLLSLHRWRFASGKVTLSRLTATPINDFKYAYQLPADYMVANRVIPQSDYEIFGDKIYSNQQSLALDYIFKPSETSLPATQSLYTWEVISLFSSRLCLTVSTEPALPRPTPSSDPTRLFFRRTACLIPSSVNRQPSLPEPLTSVP